MHRDPNTFHCSCCLLDKNFRIFCRSLYVSAYLDRKMSSFFLKHPISTCKSASLSIECCRLWIAWLKEWANNILTSRLPANFPWWKNPRTYPVVFMGKDDKFERKVRCKVSAYPRQSYHIKFIAVTARQLGKLMFSKRPSCLSSLFIDSKITVTVCVL